MGGGRNPMTPERDPARIEEAAEADDGAALRWYHKLGALIYVFFCFEIGVFLLLFPWLDLWQRNVLSSLTPEWLDIWNSAYLRGAVSGLGVINIGISFAELFRLRRFARVRPSDSVQ
ncbi:MAG TPA: hypothetical protein PLP04_01880 [Bryobacteraceae bacterium]|nr:hypothetical protein [Bryobacteraceae bacterium]HPQ13944.1 hypothetical protein [Bryobacteraceae bacterium]